MFISKKRNLVLVGAGLAVIGLLVFLFSFRTAENPGDHHHHGGEVAEEFLRLVRDQNPRAALDKLRTEIRQDTARLRSCHPIVHAIGREAYRKYGDFAEAIGFGDNICNSGYLHGVIEGHFERASDPLTAMRTVCNPYPPKSLMSWECFHGIGHGVMFFTHKDLKASLTLCDSYEAESASSSCVSGVFMEYFTFEPEDAGLRFSTERDPFDQCGRQSPRHKSDCYLYSPQYYLTLNESDYSGALTWCLAAEKPFHLFCSYGVGNQAIKENIQNPRLVEAICMGAAPQQVEPCISGLVGLYLNHFGSPEPAKELCRELKETNRKTCDRMVAGWSKRFQT